MVTAPPSTINVIANNHQPPALSMEAIRGELGNKLPFDGVLFGFFQLGVLIGCIPGHGTYIKTILVGFLCWSSYHLIAKTTTGDFAGDMGVGSVITTQFLIALDTMFFTDPNTLKNHHEPHSGNITEHPLSQRVRWAFNLYTNNRGIGWAHEPRILPKRLSSSTPRWKFVLVRLITAALCVLFEFPVVVAEASNPGLTTSERVLSEAPFIWRALGVACFGFAGGARMNAMNCVISAVVVGFGLSQPDRWPDLFGSPLEAWSVRNVWRIVWHQMLRKPLVGCTDFILTKIFGLQPLSHKTNNMILDTGKWLLWTYTLFFIVGVVHLGGEYMLLGRLGFGALKFFSLQAVGITLERFVSFVWSHLESKSNRGGVRAPNDRSANRAHASKSSIVANSHPQIWIRLVGYLWVTLWFTWSLAFNIDPMVTTGMFVDPRYDLRKNNWTSIILRGRSLS